MIENYKVAVGDGFVQAGCGGLETFENAGSALETMLTRAQDFRTQKASNDNDDGGDDTPPPSSEAKICDVEFEEVDDTSYVAIDVDEVAKRTCIPKHDLELICANDSKALVIPTNILELNQFITVQEGASKTAAALANKKVLPPETRRYFLRKSQEYGYLWLKGEAQLGNEIRKIRTKQGSRSDLKAANDNEAKCKNADLDEVLTELRSKKDILAEDYNIGYTQARQLTRLTYELVEKEFKYAIANNDTLSRTHALSFLNQPPALTDEEKEEASTVHAKAKFIFETIKSTRPYESLKNLRLKQQLQYCSLFACIGSGEYYLEDYGFKCVLANELEPSRAEYFKAMMPDANMVVGDFREKYDELVKAFKESGAQLLTATIPCQTYCTQKGKGWRDDVRLTLVLDYVRFIKDTKPKHLVLENAKEFFGFSLPLTENLADHPIAEQLQKELNGKTIGDYLRDELTAEGLEYDLNFAIEDACFYGTAQSRVRSIMLGSQNGTWKFPKAEEFAMPLWEAIGHLPSREAGEDSGIPYHKASLLHSDPEINDKMVDVLAHTGTGRKSQDNDPKYQLPGFGFFGAKGARKFWDRPSNTIDSGSGSILGSRTVHPGRIRKDGTYSDCRPMTLLEVFLTNGLPKDYEVPEKFRERESFVREVMGEIFLPRMLERICLEIPVPTDDWTEIADKSEQEE